MLARRRWDPGPEETTATPDRNAQRQNAHSTIGGSSSFQNAPPCEPARSIMTTSAPASRSARIEGSNNLAALGDEVVLRRLAAPAIERFLTDWEYTYDSDEDYGQAGAAERATRCISGW